MQKTSESIRYQAYPYLESIVRENENEAQLVSSFYLLEEFSRIGEDFELSKDYFCKALEISKKHEVDLRVLDIINIQFKLLPKEYEGCNF